MAVPYLTCDRCDKTITEFEPFVTCNIINKRDYTWTTRNLCEKCNKDLFIFLGESKDEHKPAPMEFWYGVDLAEDTE